MPFEVFLTDAVARDMAELYDYLERHVGRGTADHVLVQIEKAFASLSETPHRGAFPKELLSLGIREYRELYFKPYRLLYRILDPNVYVLAIADGRRDLQALLQRRLLEP